METERIKRTSLRTVRKETKMSRTRSLRKIFLAPRPRRATRNPARILKRLLRNSRRSTPHLLNMCRIPGYRKYS